MTEQRSGAIVNLGSQSPRGLYRLPYAVGEGGLFALTKVLSTEYGRYGIRVNTVAPGGTEVPDQITSRLASRPRVMVEALETEEYKAYREGSTRLDLVRVSRNIILMSIPAPAFWSHPQKSHLPSTPSAE